MFVGRGWEATGAVAATVASVSEVGGDRLPYHLWRVCAGVTCVCVCVYVRRVCV